MPRGLPDPRELGYYYSLAQVGLEMVAPIALGVWLDNRFGLTPWATVVGAVVGLVGGIAHLMILLKRHEERDSRPPKQGSP
jgi:F0F1-type ATP synthase assembly protein I